MYEGTKGGQVQGLPTRDKAFISIAYTLADFILSLSIVTLCEVATIFFEENSSDFAQWPKIIL